MKPVQKLENKKRNRWNPMRVLCDMCPAFQGNLAKSRVSEGVLI